VRINFSRPGTPTDNGHVETFNGSLRDECLNVHWFASMAEARASIEAWRQDYNESRLHMTLGNESPGELARKSRDLADRPSAKGAED
jgi:putative transposase